MSNKPILSRLVIPVALLALALGAGACGDDEEAESADMTSTSAPEAGTGAETEEATATDKVAIVDFQFKPVTIQVDAGTTVTWTNEDGFAHTATADDKSFDTGNLDKGQSGTATFEEPGTFKYFCAIHNSMVGTVVVK